MAAGLIRSLVVHACKASLRAFVETYCWIQNKFDAEQEGFSPHTYQEKIIEISDWCEANNVPCRIVGLKPRRGGSSTVVIAILYHRLMKQLRRACILVGREYQGMMMFKMLSTMAKKDRSNPIKAQVLDTEARFPNGSYCVRVNASGEDAAVSGGFTFLHVTELAKWAQEGVAAAASVLSAALKCVPFLPGTTIIIESTCEGVGDEFHRIYTTGITFEELKAGKVGYVKVFAPWFEFRDAVLDPPSMGLNSLEDLTRDEVDLSARYSLTLAQIAWMRYTVHDQCHDSFDEFKRDYPFNDVECFSLTGRKCFSQRGIEKMKQDSAKFPYSMGVLDFPKGPSHNATTAIWRAASPEDCRFLRWEQPRDGMKYLVAVDSMTGASQTVGEDPDSHFVAVWRAGYFERGQWRPPKIVCHLMDDMEAWIRSRTYTLQWDIDVLEEQIWRLALYYGNCMIVPEMNKDRGIVELLKLRNGANIYVRTQFNRREQTESNALGWVTNGENRGRMITLLQQGIREYANVDPVKGWSQDRCEIYSPVILDQLETFIIKSDGRTEAMSGRHDDAVLATAIGLATIDGASTYQRPQGAPLYDPFDETGPQLRKASGTYS